MGTVTLNGIFVPHITPFNSNGSIDEKALRRCVNFWVEGGLSGLVPCGSNGEAPYLSREERKRIIRIVLEEVKEDICVIAGTGTTSTNETIQLTRDAKDLGVDAALVVTPFYYKPSNRELYEHYRSILEAVDLPIVLYSVPKFTGFHLDTSVIASLVSEYSSIVGIKDSGGDVGRITETFRLVGDKISVLAGTTDLTLPTLMIGGKGAVIAIANVLPKMCNQLYQAYRNDVKVEAVKLQQLLSYYNEILVKRHNQLAAIKEALVLRGLPAGYPRRPTLPLEPEAKNEIKKLVETMKE